MLPTFVKQSRWRMFKEIIYCFSGIIIRDALAQGLALKVRFFFSRSFVVWIACAVTLPFLAKMAIVSLCARAMNPFPVQHKKQTNRALASLAEFQRWAEADEHCKRRAIIRRQQKANRRKKVIHELVLLPIC